MNDVSMYCQALQLIPTMYLINKKWDKFHAGKSFFLTFQQPLNEVVNVDLALGHVRSKAAFDTRFQSLYITAFF